jgi:kynurenine formamidase
MSDPMAQPSALAALVALLGAGEWVDLTPVIESGMPRWPSHPPVVVHPTVTHEHDGYFTQTIFMSEHSGAHVDAPAHALPGGDTIETFPPDFLVRPAKVMHWEGRDWRPGELATAADFARWERETGLTIGSGDVVLVDYGWLAKHWRTDGEWRWYAENMPGMDESVADLLLERGVRAVGTDTIACGSGVVEGRSVPPEGCWLHAKLLPVGVLLVECLRNLERLPDECLFVALPLPFAGGSGSPVRAVAFVPGGAPPAA